MHAGAAQSTSANERELRRERSEAAPMRGMAPDAVGRKTRRAEFFALPFLQIQSQLIRLYTAERFCT